MDGEPYYSLCGTLVLAAAEQQTKLLLASVAITQYWRAQLVLYYRSRALLGTVRL